jgi:ELWxxDGT repeat protein
MQFLKMLFVALFLCATSVKAQTPRLTKDINKTYLNGYPTAFCAVNGYLYFNGRNEVNGTELWRSDGTTAGTKLFADIVKGPSPSDPVALTKVGNTLFFIATTADYGRELWKVDSGATAPVMVKDIRAGVGNSGVVNLFAYKNKLYFSAGANASGDYELYTSDGTDTGTYMVKDINPGTANSQPILFTICKDILYFVATSTVTGQELWRTDGTASGTYLVKDIYPGASGSSISSLAAYKDTLYFNASAPGTPSTYLGLWKSDGTDTGTVKVPSGTATAYSSVNYLTVCNNWLYFSAYNSTVGQELFRTNGSNVVLMKDIDPGNTGSAPTSLVTVDTILYFTATGYNGRELHRCIGTSAGTGLIRDLYPIQTDAQINNMTAVGNTLFFTAQESPNYGDIELFKCKGTSISRVKDIWAGSSGSSQPTNFYAWNGKLYFSANDNISGYELWVSDATSTGTLMLKDVNNGTLGSGITSMAEYKGGVLFNANEPTFKDELWRSAGDSSKTKLVKDIGTNSPYSSTPRKLKSLAGKVHFTTEPYSSYGEHFYSDGVSVTEVTTSSSYYGQPDNWTTFNGKTYYTWNQSGFYPDLYYITASNSGAKVMTLDISKLGDRVGNLTVFRDQLFFCASDGTSGTGVELYKATKSNSVSLVKDIYSSYYSSNPSNLLVIDTAQMLFTATTNTTGTELYTTDGTTAGTKILKDIVSGAGSSGPSNLIKLGKYTYFTATTTTNGRELWRTDGSAAGTVLFADINAGTSSSSPSKFVVVDTLLYFLADDGSNGLELWVTNGTTAGTYLVKDFIQGSGSSNVLNLTPVGKWLYFSANDGVNGQELWRTNSTITTMIQEVYEGAQSTNPSLLTLHNDTLYYTADHPEFGNELWYVYTKCMNVKFKASQTCVGTPVDFTNTTDSFGRTMKNLIWNFGDTTIQNTTKTTKCVFNSSGKKKVVLTVTNEDGCTENWSDSVIVYDKPIAKFTTNNDTQCLATNAFSFTNVSTPIKAMKHEWNYGVGVLDTMKVGYKNYTAIGTYKVKLIERLGSYCADSMIDTVAVMPKPVDINIVGKATTITAQDTFTAVVAKAKSVYAWVITGGTKLSGGNSSEIVVKWNTPPVTASIKVTEMDSFGCLGTQKSKTVTVQKPVAVNGLESIGIQMFPNPTSQKLQIISKELFVKNAKVYVVNGLGQVVYQGLMNGSKFELDCSVFAAGIYSVVIENAGGIFTDKLIVE